MLICNLSFIIYHLNQLWQEAGDDQYDDADNQDRYGLGRASLPFLQDDAPDIGEHDVERHQDAE